MHAHDYLTHDTPMVALSLIVGLSVEEDEQLRLHYSGDCALFMYILRNAFSGLLASWCISHIIIIIIIIIDSCFETGTPACLSNSVQPIYNIFFFLFFLFVCIETSFHLAESGLSLILTSKFTSSFLSSLLLFSKCNVDFSQKYY